MLILRVAFASRWLVGRGVASNLDASCLGIYTSLVTRYRRRHLKLGSNVLVGSASRAWRSTTTCEVLKENFNVMQGLHNLLGFGVFGVRLRFGVWNHSLRVGQ
jgi:hypothetical protein